MRAFEIHKPKDAPPPPPKPRRHRRWLLTLLFLMLAGGVGLAVRPDPKVARAQLQEELFATRPTGPPTPEARAKMDELKQVMSTLSRDQKQQLFEPMREKMKADFDKYFTMSSKEKTQVLDQQIDREEKWKKDREKAGKTAGGPPNAGGGPKGGGGSPKGGGGPKGSSSPKTPDQVKDRSKQRLDNSTAEDRAKRDQFRKDMENRRKQRGLPAGGR